MFKNNVMPITSFTFAVVKVTFIFQFFLCGIFGICGGVTKNHCCVSVTLCKYFVFVKLFLWLFRKKRTKLYCHLVTLKIFRKLNYLTFFILTFSCLYSHNDLNMRGWGIWESYANLRHRILWTQMTIQYPQIVTFKNIFLQIVGQLCLQP